MTLHLWPRGLRYLDAVARLGSIQAASRDLGISASAIDRQILMLEAQLEAPLFERKANGMRLTPAGEAALALARRWRGDAHGLRSQIKQMQGVETGHVRIVAMDSLVNHVIPTFVARFAQLNPKVSVAIEVTSPAAATEAIEAGAADVAIAFNLGRSRDHHVLWTAELPFGCVTAPDHPLASHPHVSVGEVVAHPVAAQSRSLPIRRLLERRQGWPFASDEPPLSTNSLQLIKRIARAGGHVAVTSELDAAPEILDGSLVFIPIRARDLPPQTVSVVISATRPALRIVQFAAQALADTAGETLAEARAVIAKARHDGSASSST